MKAPRNRSSRFLSGLNNYIYVTPRLLITIYGHICGLDHLLYNSPQLIPKSIPVLYSDLKCFPS